MNFKLLGNYRSDTKVLTSEIVLNNMMQLRTLFLVVVLVMTGFILLAGLICFNHKTSKYYLGHILMEHRRTNTAVTNSKGLAMNSQRIVYNRVPKCGSRSIMSLFEAMAEKHYFRAIESKVNSPFHLSLSDRERIAMLVKGFTPPFLYHRHFHFMEFEKLMCGTVGNIFYHSIFLRLL